MNFRYEFKQISLRLVDKTLIIRPKFEINAKVSTVLDEHSIPLNDKKKTQLPIAQPKLNNAAASLEHKSNGPDKNNKPLLTSEKTQSELLIKNIGFELACESIQSYSNLASKNTSTESKTSDQNKSSNMTTTFSHQKNKSFHFEFRDGMDKDLFTKVLGAMSSNGIVSREEQSKCQEIYSKFGEFFLPLSNSLEETKAATPSLTKASHKITIIRFISQCKDNEMLVLLHFYLLSQKFDNLRAFTGKTKMSLWQGENLEGKITKTTSTWAQIEKAISLQVGSNVGKSNDLNLAARRTHILELSKHNPFLSIKRNRLTSLFTDTSKNFDRAIGSNKIKFDKAYESYFKKYRQ